MNSISLLNIVRSSLIADCFLFVRYEQQQYSSTFFIRIKDISFDKRTNRICLLSRVYNKNHHPDPIEEDLSIYLDKISNLTLLKEETHFSYDPNLKQKLIKTIDSIYSSLTSVSDDDLSSLFDYYLDAIEHDSKIFVESNKTIPGIDLDVLKEYKDAPYHLSSNQYNALIDIITSRQKSKKKNVAWLYVSELSLKYKHKNFPLVFHPLKFDIENSLLIYDNEIYFNDLLNDQYSEVLPFTIKNGYTFNDFKDTYPLSMSKALSYFNLNKDIVLDLNPFCLILEDKTNSYNAISFLKRKYEYGQLSKLVEIALGLKENSNIVLPKSTIFRKCNESQSLAINRANTNYLSFIFGPPGTGKSFTLISLILQSLFSKQKVLLSANANHPIDEIENKFKDLRENKYPIYIPYFRLGNIEKMAESIDYVRLCYRCLKSENISYQNDFQIDSFDSKDIMDLTKLRFIANSFLLKLEENKELYSIICYKDEDKENSTNLLSAVKRLRQYLVRKENFEEFSKVFPIILSTCASTNKLPLEFDLFDLVLLDESASCPLVSGLSPLIRGKRAVLCGDKKQLNAFTLIDQRINRGLMQKYNVSNRYSYNELSLLDFIEYKVKPFPSTMLNEHYRCQKDIIDFCNRNFYESKMKIMTPKDDLDHHLFVYQIKNHSSTSNHSDEEAIFIINYIIDNHLDLTDIGIITPFVAQSNNIKKHLKKYFPENFNDVSVGTVHSFQGDQKDVIFFSLGCHDKTSIRTLNSFVSKPSLVNVAISRAKKLFIAIGEFNLFEENYIYNVNYWLKLKNYAKSLNTFSLVESNKVYESKNRTIAKKSGLSKAESEFYSTLHQILSVLKGKYKLETHTYLSEIIGDNKVKEDFKNYHLDFLIRIEDTDKMIGIELDGEEHYLSKEKIQNDMKKDRLLLSYPNIKLLRFKNEERLLYTKVKDIIKDTIRSLLDIKTIVL